MLKVIHIKTFLFLTFATTNESIATVNDVKSSIRDC